MTLGDFINELGEAYTAVGRPPLEGRLVALLLAGPEPQTLAQLAKTLRVSKSALLRVVRPMVERGDLKRWREPSSREHSLALTDHAYIHDLRVQIHSTERVLRALEAMSRKKLDPHSQAQLKRQAEVSKQTLRGLTAIVNSVEKDQEKDLREHLERDWDALPPSRGRGRDPKKDLSPKDLD
jgi:DNA-binding transcriptional regulator GbsR (MarR family)